MNPHSLPTYGSLRFTDDDIHLFHEGTHYKLHEKMGAHLAVHEGEEGAAFTLWAPNAHSVSVVGEFNGWDASSHPLSIVPNSGVWQTFVPGAISGQLYKYEIRSRLDERITQKADPFAFFAEVPPRTASRIWDGSHDWSDDSWMADRHTNNSLDAPVAVYEMHAGSWMRFRDEGNRMPTWRELAPRLAEYLEEMQFTHVELLPVMLHPYHKSWGYQITGFFSPSPSFGPPEDFMYFVDHLHSRGFGVILDWVPSHFPGDDHGLALFDGGHLYEYEDPRKGYHREWGSYVFDYGKGEVRSFLLSSAVFWLDRFHADGLRVDAVASMLYLDYSRRDGEWIANVYGGNENLEAVQFIKKLNEIVYANFPDTQTIAEESTAWPGVSRPTYTGGLGFGMKWDMGWMHDTLQYLSHEPIFRKFHHNMITFRMIYAFSENFMLSLSHDEVVHGKRSLLEKMPGDDWQKFANLRLLFSFMYSQSGKKLLFMGGELGVRSEWNEDEELEWDLLQYDSHKGIQRLVTDLNRIYKREKALYERDFHHRGFEWIDGSDSQQSILTFERTDTTENERILVAINFTPVVRYEYRVGVSRGGYWREIFNSDSHFYGGSGQGNMGGIRTEEISWHGRSNSLLLTLPPLGAVFLKHDPLGLV